MPSNVTVTMTPGEYEEWRQYQEFCALRRPPVARDVPLRLLPLFADAHRRGFDAESIDDNPYSREVDQRIQYAAGGHVAEVPTKR